MPVNIASFKFGNGYVTQIEAAGTVLCHGIAGSSADSLGRALTRFVERLNRREAFELTVGG
jgi:hypothetical protein